jgi:hypothetical protein
MSVHKIKLIKLAVGCILVLGYGESRAQLHLKDSVIPIHMVATSYALEIPGADMASRFGSGNTIELQYLYKTKKNWIYGFSTDYLFGNRVKETDMLSNITTPDGFLIASNGKLVDHQFQEEGFTTFLKIGKLIPRWGPNPNSGIVAMAGLGFMEEHIRINLVDGNDQIAPQLDAQMRKGYDRLSNGIAFEQYIGYVFLSNKRYLNFYAGVDITEGLTKDRRYDYDLNAYNNALRYDILYGIRVGWILPIYKRAPKDFYTY